MPEQPSGVPIRPDQSLLIDLIAWLKRERSENMALRSALQIAAHLEPQVTNAILEEKAVQIPACARAVNAEFRQVESALTAGQTYLSALELLLKRHGSIS